MKKILILGAAGMAGHVIYNYFTNIGDYEVFGSVNQESFNEIKLKINISDLDQVKNAIENIKPDIIINCIGMLIRSSKRYPDKTIYANSFFPHYLARLSSKYSFKLIHISTDCVFSGKSGAYTEDSFKDATDLYGLSKSLGEINDDHNLTIRTSIIGPEIKKDGEGLFHWFMSQKGEVSGYKSNFWSGVTTLELAKFIYWQIKNPEIGIIHLTNNQKISKFELLTLINEIHQMGMSINSDKDYVCDKSFLNTKMREYKVESYEKMLSEQKEFIDKHSFLYSYL